MLRGLYPRAGPAAAEAPRGLAAPRPCDTLPAVSPGVRTSTYSVSIAAAFGMTVLWALVVIVNKKVLEDVHPVAVNFFVRIVAVVGLVCLTVPLTVFHLWSNGFGIDAAAAGWIALSAVATWLVAFNAYYYALRGGLIAVVMPISSTDPLWTAVFAWLILGTAFGGLTIAGMAVAMAGVLLISRSMEAGGEAAAGALAGAAHGDVLPGEGAPAGGGAAAATAPAPDGRLRLIALAVVAAAGWGIGPVLVELASQAYGKPTATMMIESQALGVLLLGALLLVRRTPLATRRLRPAPAAPRRPAARRRRACSRPSSPCSSTSASPASARCSRCSSWRRRRSSRSCSASCSCASAPARAWRSPPRSPSPACCSRSLDGLR